MANKHKNKRVDWNTVWPLVGIILALASNIFLRGPVSIVCWHVFLLIALCWLGIHLVRTKTSSKLAVGLIVAAFFLLTGFSAFTEWPEIPKPLVFKAVEALGHQQGDMVGGFSWDSRFHDVRLTIDNNNGYPVKDLDLTVQVDANTETMAGMGLISGCTQPTFTPPQLPDSSITIRGNDGKESVLSARDSGFTMHSGVEWKMSCPLIPAGTQIRVVIAAIRNNDGSVPKNIKVSGSYQSISRNVNEPVLIKAVLPIGP
ncbi:MAG TPA: hypothetical protein VGD60_01090 [Candidatus Acidoferrales bacterium]